MEICCRPIEPLEAKNASEIESLCLNTAWSEEQIANLPKNAIYLAAFEGKAMCGIASVYTVLDEGQIMNVAVLPEYRRKGIALKLMKALITTLAEKGCEIITLEVAENNLSAISLYEKCGFTAVGKRKGFYGDISALIMEIKL